MSSAWRVPLDGIDALAVGESVVVAACPAEMHGLQAKSGDALWRVDGIESDGSTMLAVRDGVVRCWAVSGVHSFELRTGRAVHDAERGPVGARRRTAAEIVVGSEGLRVQPLSHSIRAIDPRGTVRWRFRLRDGIDAGPVAQGHRIFVAGPTKLYALSAATGAVEWSVRATSRSFDACRDIVVDDDWVYFGLADGTLCGVDVSGQDAPPDLAKVLAWKPPPFDHDAWIRAWVEGVRAMGGLGVPRELADFPLPAGAVVVGRSATTSTREFSFVVSQGVDETVEWVLERLRPLGYEVSPPRAIEHPLGHGVTLRYQTMSFEVPDGRTGSMIAQTHPVGAVVTVRVSLPDQIDR